MQKGDDSRKTSANAATSRPYRRLGLGACWLRGDSLLFVCPGSSWLFPSLTLIPSRRCLRLTRNTSREADRHHPTHVVERCLAVANAPIAHRQHPHRKSRSRRTDASSSLRRIRWHQSLASLRQCPKRGAHARRRSKSERRLAITLTPPGLSMPWSRALSMLHRLQACSDS